MRTLKLKGIVDSNRKLSLTLPPETPVGEVDVIVQVDDAGNKEDDEETKRRKEKALAELKEFHKGRTLGDITLRELIAEGRR